MLVLEHEKQSEQVEPDDDANGTPCMHLHVMCNVNQNNNWYITFYCTSIGSVLQHISHIDTYNINFDVLLWWFNNIYIYHWALIQSRLVHCSDAMYIFAATATTHRRWFINMIFFFFCYHILTDVIILNSKQMTDWILRHSQHKKSYNNNNNKPIYQTISTFHLAIYQTHESWVHWAYEKITPSSSPLFLPLTYEICENNLVDNAFLTVPYHSC